MRTLAFLNGECLGFEATNQDTVKHESEPILNRNQHVKHISGCSCNLCINCAKELKKEQRLLRIKYHLKLTKEEINQLEQGELDPIIPYIYGVGYEYHTISCHCTNCLDTRDMLSDYCNENYCLYNSCSDNDEIDIQDNQTIDDNQIISQKAASKTSSYIASGTIFKSPLEQKPFEVARSRSRSKSKRKPKAIKAKFKPKSKSTFSFKKSFYLDESPQKQS